MGMSQVRVSRTKKRCWSGWKMTVEFAVFPKKQSCSDFLSLMQPLPQTLQGYRTILAVSQKQNAIPIFLSAIVTNKNPSEKVHKLQEISFFPGRLTKIWKQGSKDHCGCYHIFAELNMIAGMGAICKMSGLRISTMKEKTPPATIIPARKPSNTWENYLQQVHFPTSSSFFCRVAFSTKVVWISFS